MDPQIRNFSQIEKLIRENPKEADAQAFQWRQFLKNNANESPELYSIDTAEEFYKWAQEHPEKNIDTSVYVGKEISDSYYYLREKHEDEQMRTGGRVDTHSIPAELISLPLLAAAFFEKPKIMEDDKDYQKIEEKLKKEWLEKNPGKDFSSKEGIDYLYGSLEDSMVQSLAKESENSFRSNPKFKKGVERYDKEKKKIYKNPDEDPNLRAHNLLKEVHLGARLKYLKTHDSEKTAREITDLVIKKSDQEFAAKFPEKTKAYSQNNVGLENAQEKVQINEALVSYASASGKEIKYVEKKHREPSNISVSDANRILEEISKAKKSLPSEPPKIQVPEFFSRDPSIEQLGRGVGQEIGQGENVAQRGLLRTGRVGSRAANQAGRVAAQAGRLAAQAGTRVGVALFASPVGWVIIAATAVAIITFVIVFSFGGGGSSPSFTQEVNASPFASPSATLAPEESITPTPAAL